jgi:hypothetical protein
MCWGIGSIGGGPTRAFMQALRAAEKVARYRHAQLSAVKLAGDINAKLTDSASPDELIAKLKGELHKLAPTMTQRCARAAGVENRGRLDRDRARLAFKGLSPAGCPFPAGVAPAEPAGAVSKWRTFSRTGRRL